jgi:subtilase family serine protease
MGQEAGACRWHLTGYAAVAVPLSSWLPFSLLAFGCASSARPPVPVSLPVPRSGQITFYLSLPSSTSALGEAVDRVAAPGSSQYRHFTSPDQAARQFGASDAQITAVARAIGRLGLRFAADPTRLFGRVTGSARQWKAALRAPLSTQAATASSPFTTYTLPAHTPGALQPKGATLLTRQTEVYDRAAEGSRPPSGERPSPSPGAASRPAQANGVRPWPFNTGTPLVADCSSPLLQDRRVYTPQQVQTAYGLNRLRAHVSGTPVITVLDLGGGWLPGDLKLAGRCFGYTPPKVRQTQGDGVPAAIIHADDETSLDLQTVSATAPGAQVRLVQTTPAGLLDGFSRALADPGGVPDVISLSYGACGKCTSHPVSALSSWP